MHFSNRCNWSTDLNRLTRSAAGRRARGERIVDLTRSNPTTAGFDYPVDELSAILSRAAVHPYRPDPLGLPSARAALAEALSRPGDGVSPDDLVLTASTSEAYSFLFRLLCNAGESILTAVPSYPLFDYLAALDSVRLQHFQLEFQGRWEIDESAAAAAVTPTTRALVVVHPNNPTGSYVRVEERDALFRLAATRGIALISDEVFYDYPLVDDPRRAPSLGTEAPVLTFSLGGLSKSAGMPHWKLAWIRVSGPSEAKRRALEALELIADTWLSVSTPVQHALGDLLRLAPGIRAQVAERCRANLGVLASALEPLPAAALLQPEGGWSAVVRIPAIEGDEEVAVRLLDQTGVLLHPGYFFDFPSGGYLVVSLLTPRSEMEEGAAHLARFLAGYLQRG